MKMMSIVKLKKYTCHKAFYIFSFIFAIVVLKIIVSTAFSSGTERSKHNEDISILKANENKILERIRFLLECQRLSGSLNLTSDIQKYILLEIEKLEDLNNISEEKRTISKNLSQYIQNRIRKLQNPRNCMSARKLYCNVTNNSGIASGVHDILQCSVQAYLSNSMLVILSSKWHYVPGGWNKYFRPLSETCTQDYKPANLTNWPNFKDRVRILDYLPEELVKQLSMLSSNPLPWWYGQFLGYLLTPSKRINALIKKKTRELNISHPVLGMHIRRSDKVKYEARSHPIEEYMKHAEYYFSMLRIRNVTLDQKRIFVATDEPDVLTELRKKYPQYVFLHNAEGAKLANNVKTRYTAEAIRATLVDLYILANTDFIVCTFSSGFCRLAYELMQFLQHNALEKAVSLDVEFFYANIPRPPRVALFSEQNEDRVSSDIEIKTGDVLRDPSYFFVRDANRNRAFDGRIYGKNLRSGKNGMYAIYKTKNAIQIINSTVLV